MRIVKARLLLTGLDCVQDAAHNLRQSLERVLTGDDETDPATSETINELDNVLEEYAQLRNAWTEADDIDMDDLEVAFAENSHKKDK